MTRYKTVFTTERSARQQKAALAAAADILDITMLRQPDKESLSGHLAGATYLVSERAGVIDAGILRAARHLKVILRLGSLTHDIDTETAAALAIAVCTWPEAGVIRVAEHIVMQMLALTKRLREVGAIALEAGSQWGESKRTDEDVFAYNWSTRRHVDGLWRKTVGIVGFGEVGAELARRLAGWDCHVLYHKRPRLPGTTERSLGIAYAEQDELLAQSDHLVNLLPYFPHTDLLLDAAFFARMKDGAFLSSCGSGSVIDESALADAVESGKLAGAALDTFEWEPIRPDNPLIRLARLGFDVLLTPHTAAGVTASAGQERSESYTNILNHIEGRALEYRVV